MRFSHLHSPDGLNQPHITLSRLCPWKGSGSGNSGQNIHSKDRKGGEPPGARVQLEGQLAITPSQWPPTPGTPGLLCRHFQLGGFPPYTYCLIISKWLLQLQTLPLHRATSRKWGRKGTVEAFVSSISSLSENSFPETPCRYPFTPHWPKVGCIPQP